MNDNLYKPHEFENSFIYFGAITPLAKIFKFMKSHKDDDVYSWICEHNLQYRRTGKIRTNWQIIIGRELDVLDTNLYRLDFDHSFQKLDEQDLKKYKLRKEVERQIAWDLSYVGVNAQPDYYIIYNKLVIAPPPVEYKPIIFQHGSGFY